MDLKARLIALENRLETLAGSLLESGRISSEVREVKEDNNSTIAVDTFEASSGSSASSEIDTIEQLRGIKYTSRVQEPGGFQKDEVHPHPPALNSQSSEEVDLHKKDWLTLVESASPEGDHDSRSNTRSMSNTWTFIIADKQLIKVIQETLGAYTEHMGSTRWDAKELTLTGDYNPLILNWRLFTKLQASMSFEEHGRLYTRLCILLGYIRKYCPTMTKLKEEWEKDPGVQFQDLPAVFIPGNLFVADWFGSDSFVVRKAPQVFKVSMVTSSSIFRSSNKDFNIFAWIWDSNGSSIRPIRTLYHFRIEPNKYAKPISQLPFYPIEFFEENGRFGLEAIRCSEQYHLRRELFQKFMSGTKEANTVLSYEGDVLQPRPLSEDSEDDMPGRHGRSRMDRLVKVHMKRDCGPKLLYCYTNLRTD